MTAEEGIKRKTKEEIENDYLELSDQITRTDNKQRDYEEKVIELINKIVDGEAYINDLINYILKYKKKFKKFKNWRQFKFQVV